MIVCNWILHLLPHILSILDVNKWVKITGIQSRQWVPGSVTSKKLNPNR